MIFKFASSLLGVFLALNAEVSMAAAAKSGYAEVNGLKMYYEIQGKGSPVVVLHGAYMNTGLMKPIIDGLAKSHQVIAVDFQGHGRTADIDRPITYQNLADDVSALMSKINVPNADIFGYSLGAGVALQVAIRHPERVHRLVSASGSFKASGMYPEMLAGMDKMTVDMMKGSPWEKEYLKVAPNKNDFPKLFEKLKALDTSPQNWSEDDIRKIKSLVLVISGDSDIVRPEHSVEIFRLRGGGPSKDFMSASTNQLAIIPGASHLGVLERSDLVVPMALRFFAEQTPRPYPSGRDRR